MKLRNNPRSLVMDEVGNKTIQELESQISEIAESIEFWLKEAREMPLNIVPTEVSSVRTALQHRVAQRHLLRFARLNHCEENILFWEHVLDYRELDTKESRVQEAKKLFDQYLAVGAPMEVHVPDDLREQVQKQLAEAPPNLFDKVRNKI